MTSVRGFGGQDQSPGRTEVRLRVTYPRFPWPGRRGTRSKWGLNVGEPVGDRADAGPSRRSSSIRDTEFLEFADERPKSPAVVCKWG